MNKFKIIFAFTFFLLLAVLSCNRDDINFESPTKLLRLSADTVFLDTIYNQVRSETYAVKLYNTEDKDVQIPEISLGQGTASLYKINVDGKSGHRFTDIPLRKKDSLYIFIEIAPTANAPEAIAEDRINIQTPAGNQEITLFSVVQDAEFFIQSKTNPNRITTNTTWTNEKAKIIFGRLTVDQGKTLNIKKGTKIYFSKNSGLHITKNSHLNIEGDLGNEVVFRGIRNDARYDTLPKNWNGISLEPNASIKMNYGKIFGGTRGLSLNNNASAMVENSIIHTHQEYGIFAINATITAKNLVMNNCGEAAVGIFKGGTYNFIHSTLANYWELNNSLPGLSLYATNEYNNGSSLEFNSLTLNIRNSIIYNNRENALILKPTSGQAFNYQIQNSLLKYGTNAGFLFEGNSNIISSIINLNPKFQHFYTEKLNLRLKTDSPAKGKGNTSVAAGVPLDIVKISRLSSPSLGAYQ